MNEETLRPTEAAPTEETLPIEETSVQETASETVETIPSSDTVTKQVVQEVAPSEITRRLADEFFLLREEFSAIHSPEQLPDAVLDMATKDNIPLFDAYLRFRYYEEKRVRLEEENRRRAAARSAGSLMQGAAQTDPGQEAFLRAFRTALK